jgi:hypothetical protein
MPPHCLSGDNWLWELFTLFFVRHYMLEMKKLCLGDGVNLCPSAETIGITYLVRMGKAVFSVLV